MNSNLTFPWYAKFSLINVGAIALIYILYIGQHIIVPLIYATVFAILLNPLVNYLITFKIYKIVAISLTVLFAIFLLMILLFFISAQISMFGETYTKLKEKLLEFIKKLFHASYHPAVFDVRSNSKKIIQSYLIGLLFEAVIIAILNSFGLMILGINYALIQS